MGYGVIVQYIRPSIISATSHFFVMRALKTSSSSCFDVYNIILFDFTLGIANPSAFRGQAGVRNE
jgi:hypothetical protein